MMDPSLHIRRAVQADYESIWSIIQPVIARGDTYVFAPGTDREKMLDYWCGDDKNTYVATKEDEIVGTFIIKDNFPDLGSHVANASYMTRPDAFGQGIGKAMAEFSLEEARRLGYLAIQFNIVVKTNERAIQLWKKLGFEVIGEVLDAFNHKINGLTNAYIMYKKL